jgi:acyl-CoA synthetase (AMP-forming)/AMP-acid ligase II
MAKTQSVCSKFDLSSVNSLFTGAAPLGAEVAEDLHKIYPSWKIRQGYGEQLHPNQLNYVSLVINSNDEIGMTETCTVVCASIETDIWFGSSGSLLPSFKAKLISLDGVEITGYDQPGELVLQSPSVVLGYLNNDKANAETFILDSDGQGKWIRTGDEAVVRKAPSGNEHLFIVDRIKELIKVKVCLMAILNVYRTYIAIGHASCSR